MYRQSREEVFAECEENGEEWARAEASSPLSHGAEHAREWLQMDAAARLDAREKYAEKMRGYSERYAERSESMTRWAVWAFLLTMIVLAAYLVGVFL